ncbi:hypothetical protein ACEQ8H_001909 [Pleosporales sp. CAS-2024a]
MTRDTFDDILSRYSATAPTKLHHLDTLRYETIPAAVAQRSPTEQHLTHDEAAQLVEWKLKHGTFRPKLAALVRSNPPDLIRQTTASAFQTLASDPLAALKTLTGLKGIGPATASLLLSVAAPRSIPFFSDDLFRWCVWDECGRPGGWQRKMQYSAKEYGMVLDKVGGLMERLGVTAVDAEKVAWVLGRERVHLHLGTCHHHGGGGGGGGAKDEDEANKATIDKKRNANEDLSLENNTTTTITTTTTNQKKRKASDIKLSAEGRRKSTRTNK